MAWTWTNTFNGNLAHFWLKPKSVRKKDESFLPEYHQGSCYCATTRVAHWSHSQLSHNFWVLSWFLPSVKEKCHLCHVSGMTHSFPAPTEVHCCVCATDVWRLVFPLSVQPCTSGFVYRPPVRVQYSSFYLNTPHILKCLHLAQHFLHPMVCHLHFSGNIESSNSV